VLVHFRSINHHQNRLLFFAFRGTVPTILYGGIFNFRSVDLTLFKNSQPHKYLSLMYSVLANRGVDASTKPTETMTKVCIVYYSLYGHIRGFAESVKEGIESSGATCDVSCLFAKVEK
jgi:hypothetical protein